MDCKLEGSGYSVAMPHGADTISLDGGNLRISFHRTIRVPDSSASKSLLPPDLENEATWIKFQAQNGRRYAIKVYAGGVNAVSGLPSSTAAPPGQQDYVFVAVPLGKNRTVEGQITGSEQFAGIQFEIVKGIVWKRFRVYCADGTVITLPVDDRENVDGLCRIISEKLGKTLEASDLYDRNKMVRLERSRNENLRETRLRNIGIVDSQNTSLLEELYRKEQHGYGYEFSHFTDFPNYAEPLMSWDSQLGLGAGGFIKQHIQKDTHSASAWDHSTRTVFNVQLISAQVFEEMTGFMAPAAPINAATYHKYNLSFFNIPEPPSTITGNFGKLKSLAHLSYIDWLDNDIVLAPASDSGEFRSVNEYRQKDDGERQRLTPVQTMLAPKGVQNLMSTREVNPRTETCNIQGGSAEGKSRERAYLVSSTTSQEGANTQVSDDDFYPDFDDEVEEIPGLPFGSSAQDVWSRIYSAGL
ncbi:Hypothetical protein PENO1_090380 [Penicillium occitanis (nom. inval.)]|nr:Hypothetical protein PENO1_090380 [Penicillium occitanis (nom. inval.)]PCG94721.1 hypothetical protein PENOC_081320 [Penicillium occitanis (nom. inval.)]